MNFYAFLPKLLNMSLTGGWSKVSHPMRQYKGWVMVIQF